MKFEQHRSAQSRFALLLSPFLLASSCYTDALFRKVYRTDDLRVDAAYVTPEGSLMLGMSGYLMRHRQPCCCGPSFSSWPSRDPNACSLRELPSGCRSRNREPGSRPSMEEAAWAHSYRSLTAAGGRVVRL